MPRGLTRIIGGVLLALALVVAGLTMYHPPRASYIDVTPEPIGRPAAVAQAPPSGAVPSGVDTPGAAVDVVPTAVTNSTMTFRGQAIIVAASVFPAQQQIAPAAPIIISFAAQGEAMQGLCAETAGVLDSGLCAIRGLTVDTVDDTGVHVALTAQQSLVLGRVRDAGVALIVARDNALLMATPAAQQPAAAVADSAPAVTTAATAVVASTSAPQSQNLSAGTFVDGLPLVPIIIGVLLVVAGIAGGVFLLRRRAGGTARARPAAKAPKIGRSKRARKGPARLAPLAPAGLSLNLDRIEVQPLLDDDAAIAQSAPRAAAQSFESVSTLLEDDLFAPAPTVARPMAPAAALVGGSAAGGFSPADAQLFASDGALPSLTDAFVDREPDELGRGMHAFPSLDDALVATDDVAWPTQAAAEPWAGLADSDVFRTPASATGLAGVFDDLVAEPIAAMAELIVPFLGNPLPSAREPGALPPTAALDRQAALRWIKNKN